MNVSARSCLLVGAAAVGAAVIAVPSVQPTPPDIAVDSTHRPPLSTSLSELLESAQRVMDPFLGESHHSGMPVVPPEGRRPSGIAAPTPAPPPAPPGGRLVPQSTAGDLLVEAYVYARDRVLYYDLIEPIANGVVYGFLEPVLDDPLALQVWIDSAVRVLGDSAVTVVGFAIAQVDHFFDGLLPPLPPIATAGDGVVTAADEQAAPAAEEPVELADAAPPLDEAPRTVQTAVEEFDGNAVMAEDVDEPPAADLPVVVPDGSPAETTPPRPRPGHRLAGSLEKAADDVRAGVRDAVKRATKTADRLRDAFTPKRRTEPDTESAPDEKTETTDAGTDDSGGGDAGPSDG